MDSGNANFPTWLGLTNLLMNFLMLLGLLWAARLVRDIKIALWGYRTNGRIEGILPDIQRRLTRVENSLSPPGHQRPVVEE